MERKHKVSTRNTVLILGQEISVFHPAVQEYFERNYSLKYYMELCYSANKK
jgi:hypothetical protein